jgi:cytochrome c
MRLPITGAALAALPLLLTACDAPAEQNADAAATQSAAVAQADPVPAPSSSQPASFAACASCHSVTPGEHKIGPSLAGIHGDKAGSAQGYAYSEANRTSGVTWDDPTLDAYLAAPQKVVPGTKMSFAGVSDPAKRKELIAYIKSLK